MSQPEETMTTRQIARGLHAALARGPRLRLEPRTRAALAGSRALEDLEPRVREAMVRALSRAQDERARGALLEVAKDSGFRRLEPRAQRVVMNAIAEAEPALRLGEVYAGMFARSDVAQLDAAVAERLVREVSERAGRGWACSAMLELVGSPGFLGLELSEQLDLLQFAAGPALRGKAVDERRLLYVDDAWNDQRASLLRLLRDRAYTAAREDEQAELLRDFLYLPSRELCFLRPTSFFGRAILVVGDPSGASKLSYGQRQRRRGSIARVESPDPCVESAWRGGLRDCFATYHCERHTISADEERRFVEWIEGALSSATKFFDSALSLAESMRKRNGGGVSRGFMQFGRPCVPESDSEDDEMIEELLQQYRAAC